MKYTFLLIFFYLSFNAQAQVPAKASPFTAVKWKGDQPAVMYQDQWYNFKKIDHLTQEEIIIFCQETYPSKWKKRFSEDLVEVLEGMGYKPSKTVTLLLEKAGITNEFPGELTFANREKVKVYIQESNKPAAFISIEKAIADTEQFQELLDQHSSYARIGNYQYTKDITTLKTKISTSDSVSLYWLEKELGTILGLISDRHSSVRSMLRRQKSKYLPFAVAPFEENKVLALKVNGEGYAYFKEKYPLLIAINGKAILDILKDSDYEEVKAPQLARHFRQVQNLSRIEALLANQNLGSGESVVFTFSDISGKKTIDKKLKTINRPVTWNDIGSCFLNYSRFMESETYDSLFKTIDQKIGYIALAEMINKEDSPEFFPILESKMNAFKDAKALVIDIRENGGGRRDILRMLSSYFIKPGAKPWVANLAKVRVDSVLNQDTEGMMSRGLFTYQSPELDTADRKAIDQFMSTFQPYFTIDKNQFSSYFYMTLRNDFIKHSYYFDKPVYILMNERSFSAASVFASALKGMGNVTLVGVTTDGSSGLSKDFFLKNSGLKIKLSRMISFQRNGNTLDGFGTNPDIIIPRDLEQILSKRDSQLIQLIEIINKREK